MVDIIGNLLCSFVGTIAYAVLFNVPRKFYACCGMVGMAGWITYRLISTYTVCSFAIASFLGTVVVVLLSRILTVPMRCPLTIFLVPGIITLVPGAGVYNTAYYLVINQISMAAERGLESLKIAFSIVLGIVAVVSLPKELFLLESWIKWQSQFGKKPDFLMGQKK